MQASTQTAVVPIGSVDDVEAAVGGGEATPDG